MDPDSFLKWLTERLEALREEDSHLDNTIRGLTDRRVKLAEQIDELETTRAVYAGWKKPDHNHKVAVAESVLAGAEFRDLKPLRIADALAEVIRRKGGPVALPDLVSALQAAGKMHGSKLVTAKNVVTLAMKNQPGRFERVAPGIWTLTNKLLPEAPHSNGD